MRIVIYIIIFVLCCLSFPFRANSQFSGIIENKEIFRDTLDFGICMVGDYKQKTFRIINNGTKRLKIGPTRPSFSIERSGGPGHEFDFEEFFDIKGSPREIFIQPGDTELIDIRYESRSDTSTYPYGVKVARMTIGLYDSELSIPPESLKDYVESINIILTVRKVRHFIDGYVNNYSFDSVFINPPNPIEYKWKVANASNRYLEIDTQRVIWRTVPLEPPEFEFEKKTLPIPMPVNSQPIEWKVSYTPKNRGEDRATLLIGNNINNSLDFTYLDINGFGVEQDLVVLSSNAFGYQKDTIDLGRIWLGQSKEIWALFGNNGNMNFGAVNQYVYDGWEGEFLSDDFSIVKPIATNRHFFPTQGDTFKIKFTANRKGSFVARYVIETDIVNRNIRGITENSLREIFYLKGEGIEPKLQPEHDTIDFGNVVWHPDCPTSRTFTLKLRNVGNTELQLIDIIYKPPFSVEYFGSEPISFIPPLALDSINIVFTPNIQEKYLSELIFVTNGNPPQDSIKIILMASKADPDNVRLSISKNLRVKPGNLVSIPLEVNSELIHKARTFQTELTYNKTILRYVSYENIGTASENTDANDINISELNGGGKLRIFIQTPTKGSFFMPRNDLIKLNFASYIGDNLTTSIAFIEPLFGDGICDKVLIPLDTNGILTLDSICGLPDLLLPQGYGNFLISELSPNPASEFAIIKYIIKYEIPIEIGLYNELGILIDKFKDETQPAGTYELSINTSKYQTGIYYLQFKSGIFSTFRRLLIIK